MILRYLIGRAGLKFNELAAPVLDLFFSIPCLLSPYIVVRLIYFIGRVFVLLVYFIHGLNLVI